jgi:hypothetical protein
MRLTVATAIAVGSLLCLAACHTKSVKVQPPQPSALPVAKSWMLALEKADRAFAEAQYDVAATAYAEYLRDEPTGQCQQRDHALFQQAIVNSLPDYPAHSSAKTMAFLKEVGNCSSSPLKPVAQLFLGLYQSIDQLAAQKEQQNQQVLLLKSQMDALNAQLAEDAPVTLAAGDCTKEIPGKESALKTARVDRRDQILYELGVFYSSLSCKQHSIDKGNAYLKQVDERSPYGPSAKAILSLNGQIAQLSTDMEKQNQKVKDLTSQLERLKDIDTKRPRR